MTGRTIFNFKKEFFLFLLPLFFVFHGYVAFYPFIPTWECILLFLKYVIGSLLIACLLMFAFKSWRKGVLLTTFILAFFLFFGAIHDWLKNIFPESIATKYSFILPLFILLFILFYRRLKRSSNSFTTLINYLNLTLILLICIDLIVLVKISITTESKDISPEKPTLAICNGCTKPDIFFIIADEYAGDKSLIDVFHFSNSKLDTALSRLNFYKTAATLSNYNQTVYSMASCFNMNYLPKTVGKKVNLYDMFLCRNWIKNSTVVNYLKNTGYSIYDYSFFDLANEKKLVHNPYFIDPTSAITAQTFDNRVKHDLGFHFASRAAIESQLKTDLYNNLKTDSLTRVIALQKSNAPKFVYTHLSMPHHPYYYDSAGHETPASLLTNQNDTNKAAYISYLKYVNTKLVSLIDQIQSATDKKAIIILISDHGFRQFTSAQMDPYWFYTINYIYLPDGNYKGFYQGMSNVNEFRVLLNTEFNQHLPLLKDSTIFLKE